MKYVKGDMEAENKPKEQTPAPADTNVEAKVETETQAEKPSRSVRSELRKQFKSGDVKEIAKEAPSGIKQIEASKPSDTKVVAVGNEAAAQPVRDPILPPADMSAEEKADWAKLPYEAQKYLARRAYETRTDYTKKTEAVAAKEREIAALTGLNIENVRSEYARHGIPLNTVFENAIAWDRAFRTNPQVAAREYLATWGIKPEELIGTAKEQNAPQFRPEDMQRLIDERVNEKLETERQSVYTQQIFSAVESFKKDKPLFRDPGTAAQLEQAMYPIVAGLRTQNPSRSELEILEEAYGLVTRGTPQFADLLSKIDSRAKAESQNAEAVKALQASRAISGGPGTGSPQKEVKGIRNALRLAMNNQL